MRVVDHADEDVQLFLREFTKRFGEALHDVVDDGGSHVIIGQHVRCGVTDRPVSQR